MLPAKWIWAATIDLKAHVLGGEQFHDIRGQVVLVLFAAVALITIAAFNLNAAFAFAISQARIPGPASRLRPATPAPKDGHRLGASPPAWRWPSPPCWPRARGWAGSRCCSASSWPS